jgi:hypothetical protein
MRLVPHAEAQFDGVAAPEVRGVGVRVDAALWSRLPSDQV